MNKYVKDAVPFKDTSTRSFVKGISWRIVATSDTFLLSLLIFGSLKAAGSIAFLEVFTKVFLYYFHERIWNYVPFGRMKGGTVSHLRSIFKSVSWRVFGTADTITISFIITGALKSSAALGAFEVVTKIFLFYFHERVWTSVRWGRIYIDK